MLRARLDAQIATAVILFTERERQGGHRQKLYANISALYMNVTIQQLIERVSFFSKAWKHYGLELATEQSDSSCAKRRKMFFLEPDRRTTRIISIPSESGSFNVVLEKWFETYITK